MAANNEAQKDIKDYAGGWITEREHTNVPTFLRVVYMIFGVGTVSYLIAYMNGEISHPDRGILVRALNAATTAADGLMYAVAALVALFFLYMIAFAFQKE